MSQISNLVVVVVLTVLSGLLDGRGFVYAARAWPGGDLDLRLAASAVLAFATGLVCYVIAVKFLQQFGVGSVALQSAIWFVVTVVGISLMDGRIATWTRPQQIVGLLVAAGLCWLIVSTAVKAPL